MEMKKQRTLNLTLTQSCNLECSYCYEGHKSGKTMSYKTAREILDEELDKDDDYDLVEIDLFGGEPFLEFDMIKKLVRYVTSKEWKHDYIFLR